MTGNTDSESRKWGRQGDRGNGWFVVDNGALAAKGLCFSLEEGGERLLLIETACVEKYLGHFGSFQTSTGRFSVH